EQAPDPGVRQTGDLRPARRDFRGGTGRAADRPERAGGSERRAGLPAETAIAKKRKSPGSAGGLPQCVEKVAEATFSRKMRARWTSIPDEKVGPSCARSVISEAHVPRND